MPTEIGEVRSCMSYRPLTAALPRVILFAGILLAISMLAIPLYNSAFAQDGGPIEYAENGMEPVATYTATDPEGTAISSWTVTGTDAGVFDINDGVLRFMKSPDYEMSADVVGTDPSTAVADDNTYEVMVNATDSTGKMAMKEVTVEVTNVDEAGAVTLSARRPQVSVPFTAELTDPDGDVTNPTWQWDRSTSKNGTYTDIDGAEMAIYEPTDAVGESDVRFYLRATVSYTDPEGSGKTAMMKSDYTVQAARATNNAPEFAADQDPAMDGDQDAAARKVAENTAAGTNIGAPVAATDDDNDILTHTLEDADGGTDGDSASFAIDRATGQLMTKAALDHEVTECGYNVNADPTTCSYIVVVRATDPAGVPTATTRVEANSDVVTVNITVTGVNEPPAIAGEAEVTFNENPDVTDNSLGAYTADDPETSGDDNTSDVTWSVAGPDGSKFTATDGMLEFKVKPDYEMPTDANTDNVYEVTVQATDGDSNRGMKMVKVTVENEDEDGVVALSKTQPRVGIAVTASLTDPDGSISGLTWQWYNDAIILGNLEANAIEGANSDTYIPKDIDADPDSNDDDADGVTLYARVSYTDEQGADKFAVGTAANPVAFDTRNKAPVFDDQDTETDDVQNETATRKVEENTEAVAGDDAAGETDDAADNVGMEVMATDPDPNAETPTYTLSGADAAKFRVRANGQIEVGSGTELNYETKQTYMVTLTAEDSFGASTSIIVTIMVTDVDEAPDIMLGGLAISGMSSVDYPENGMGAVGTYMATGPDAAMASWRLSGDDMGDFSISNGGMLTFNGPPDYENPTDMGMDNMYMSWFGPRTRRAFPRQLPALKPTATS